MTRCVFSEVAKGQDTGLSFQGISASVLHQTRQILVPPIYMTMVHDLCPMTLVKEDETTVSQVSIFDAKRRF